MIYRYPEVLLRWFLENADELCLIFTSFAISPALPPISPSKFLAQTKS